MVSTPRLYSPSELAEGAIVELGAAQTHHLRNVLRREAGADFIVFNERDGEFTGALDAISKGRATARVGARLRTPQFEPDLWLLFAPIKRDAVDFMVEKATELGVAAFLPAITERTVVARVNVERLAANAVAAAEQSGRLSVPSVREPTKLADILADWPVERRLLYCDEAGDDPHAAWGGRQGRAPPALDVLRNSTSGPWAILIGPEGGFTEGERARLRASAFVTPITLGPRILRADTAAIAAITLWQAALGDFRCG